MGSRSVRELSERELGLGVGIGSGSWHETYAHSPCIYAGNLPLGLTEGDLLMVFEQYGVVVDVNLARHEDSGKSRGFCFLVYEDTRSAVLAVDNLNGVELLGRPIRVDHARDHRPMKKGSEVTSGAISAGVNDSIRDKYTGIDRDATARLINPCTEPGSSDRARAERVLSRWRTFVEDRHSSLPNHEHERR
mmetsp:Transcript_16131/g.32637  ORF Transcript_16131/g.32637 Transcript_16131/m.32637 type:complete len:191 (+) Transcript_16131:25-597(+)